MRSILLLFILIASLFLVAPAQSQPTLPRSTPEAQGVSSSAIVTFLDSIASGRHEFHSLMIIRHGKVIAEGWWKPYGPDLPHTLYSLSKSFTATAVGFARAEGKLQLEDKVLSFFPAEAPDTASAFLRALTIKDLLTMSVGQEPDPTGVVVQDSSWVSRFFRVPIKFSPGSRFLYNSAATYMLSAIVQKVTGEKILDYLDPRLFQPLGIAKPDWEKSPQGVNTGGWGLRLKTEDIARFAQLFLQKGIWNGKQVLPIGWAEEASAAHIVQHPEYSQAKRDSSDWEQGYGYQMWRCRNGAFRGDGAYGQYAIVMPAQDAVIAITSETPDMQGELDLIWKILLPAMKSSPLPANQTASVNLKRRLAALELTTKRETIKPATSTSKTFSIEPNAMNIRTLSIRPGKQRYELLVQTDTASHMFQLAPDGWSTGTTTMKGPYLVAAAKNNLNGLPPFRIASEYTWLDSNTLELVIRYIESPHTETMIFRFNGNRVSIDVKQSFRGSGPGAIITLQGEAK